MKLRRSRTSRRGRIEIIPMIDVMFFLLATFMLTSLSMQRLDAVHIDLPSGQAQSVPLDRPLTLSVNRSNQIFVNRQPVRLDEVSRAVAKGIRRDGNIVVAADDGASHGVVVQAILEARKAGAEHFLVAVHRE
ncbi:ExbD/TolR family protein [Paraburkholderia silvatlantica]|uniref:Outer membrane transport energization protein ExbD n=2 Tax=Paraburkholderia silvatlantica TaxID=321895 RepID=A0A2U1A712_9BURK|nr:biopolymer transporter ExbD [Paraburkholderia silvatlantica]PVY27870.1 outer membrane transport energization protein ExbD [Paraburkholderia silvatlantica]PXW34717.1 outer membrane transport energization protein ExbD [Paraburkholderia silvatlantica]PYE20555.1 outer membrane transport energization protein ExbD [Paraburkholderia silvatlantica]